jgi:hypothetical protein
MSGRRWEGKGEPCWKQEGDGREEGKPCWKQEGDGRDEGEPCWKQDGITSKSA